MARRTLFPRVTIHTEYYYRSFLTKTCTVGYAFSIAITFLVIFFPFLSTFSTGCKWFDCSITWLNDIILQTSGPGRLSRRSTPRSSSATNSIQNSSSSTTATLIFWLNTPMSIPLWSLCVTRHRTYLHRLRSSQPASTLTRTAGSINGTSLWESRSLNLNSNLNKLTS